MPLPKDIGSQKLDTVSFPGPQVPPPHRCNDFPYGGNFFIISQNITELSIRNSKKLRKIIFRETGKVVSEGINFANNIPQRCYLNPSSCKDKCYHIKSIGIKRENRLTFQGNLEEVQAGKELST